MKGAIECADKVITVSESEIAAAILTILEKQKLITEGAGAVSVAAVMSGKLDLKGRKARWSAFCSA